MMMKNTSRAAGRGHAGGFSLIELMVAMAIGLLCTLVIASVLSVTEGQRRGTTSGADAQIGGSLALYAVQREVAMAGYGFASEPNAVGCNLQARFNGAVVTALPAQLAPVFITQGGAGVSDQVRVLASSKYIMGNGNANQVGYAVATRVIPPMYDPVSADLTQRGQYNVWSTMGIRAGDLMVAVINADANCSVFEAAQTPIAAKVLPLVTNAARWNPAGFPAEATQIRCVDLTEGCAPLNNTGSLLVNMGSIVDVIFSIDAQQRLVASRLDTAAMARNIQILQGNIVMMKAMYGRDTNDDGAVDTYDYTQPTNSTEWARVLSVRIAVVARSTQYERDVVTASAPVWVVGNAAQVAGAETCGESRCVSLPVTGLSDWQHYRYKVFDTVVPLRNQRWKS